MPKFEQWNEQLKARMSEIRTRRMTLATTPEDRVRIARVAQATVDAHAAILNMLTAAGFSIAAAETCDELLQALAESHSDKLTREDVADYLELKGLTDRPAPHEALVNHMESETAAFIQALRTMTGELLREGRRYHRRHEANLRERN